MSFWFQATRANSSYTGSSSTGSREMLLTNGRVYTLDAASPARKRATSSSSSRVQSSMAPC